MAAPGACEEAVEALEQLINNIEPITTLIDRVKEQTPKGQPEDMVRALAAEIFKDMPEEFSIDILDIKEIQWQCDCSEERLEKEKGREIKKIIISTKSSLQISIYWAITVQE